VAPARGRRVPHYRQTTDFTCGPSACLMAMRTLDPGRPMRRAEELEIWREATTIFMGPSGGHGGCGALGLALALHRRGFRPEVHVNHRGLLLGKRCRVPQRREVMRLLQARDLAEARARDIPVRYDRLTLPALAAAIAAGAVPVVLCSTRHIHGDNAPHWIVVTRCDGERVHVNDPWVALDKGLSARDMTDVAVARRDFERMTCYGSEKERAAILVHGRRAGGGGGAGSGAKRRAKGERP
jgi:hypothetical protein